MIKFKLFLILIIISISKYSFSNNILVMNIDELINTNNIYINIINKIELSQEKISKKFIDKEIEIENNFKEIEESKMLLEQNELNILINNYNLKLEEFKKLVDEFNLHYQDQIINIRKIMLKEIIVLAEKYAKNNDVDLILDSTSYLIASNSINITNIIKERLDNIDLKLEFEPFEYN